MMMIMMMNRMLDSRKVGKLEVTSYVFTKKKHKILCIKQIQNSNIVKKTLIISATNIIIL